MMNSVTKSLPFHLFICLLIFFGNLSEISGQETKSQSLNNPRLEPVSAVQISAGCSEYRTCCIPEKITYLYGSQKVNFFQAMILCGQLGMELASVNSMEEQIALENYTRTVEPKSGALEGYWIAGTRHGSFGTEFVWLTTGKPVVYKKFPPGQPDNFRGDEHCLELVMQDSDNFQWNDVRCETSLKFLCQLKKQCL